MKLPLILIVASLCCGLVQAQQDNKIEKPNFIIILADDLGYGDLGIYGGSTPTPNLDKMAAQGMLFTDFHSSGTSCSPTRAGLVTGRYQHRAGVDGVINADPEHPSHKTGIDPIIEVTYPGLLKQAGYKNALIGKWHLGYLPKYNPVNFGFDEFKGFLSGNIDYISHYNRMQAFDWWDGRNPVKEEGYSTHLITEHTIHFIQENKDHPFSILVAHAAVHSPMQGPNSPVQRGPGKEERRDPTSNEAIFKLMLTELDKSVGEIMKTVVKQGIADRTLIVFTSDNGPMIHASAGELKGKKGSMYEGGHRVPMIAWWPGTIKAGEISAQTTTSLDLMPTMLALAGAESPVNYQFDGINLFPVFKQQALSRRQFFWRNSGINNANLREPVGPDMPKAMRDGKWKLVVSPYYKNVELYDLSTDSGEKNNMATAHPQRVAAMLLAVKKWEKEMMQTLLYTTR